MKNPRFPASLFTPGVLCFLAVMVLTSALTLCTADADIAEVKAKARRDGNKSPPQEKMAQIDPCNLVPADDPTVNAEDLLHYDQDINRSAAEQGDAKEQFMLGYMYRFGKGGIPKNDAETVKWYPKAAEQGDADAQNYLGWIYHNGQGLPKNNVEAYK